MAKAELNLGKIAGCFLILSGLLCCPWIICPLFGRDVAILHPFQKIFLILLAAFLFLEGTVLVRLSRNPKQGLPNFILVNGTLLLCFILLYSSLVIVRTRTVYLRLEHKERGWGGRLFAAHPELGFANIPNSRGSMIFPIGPDLPLRHDREGFRIPVDADEDSPRRRPLVLSLGCSFTYGDACPAEDTFTYLTGQALGGSSINAGGCAYGLPQMLIRARQVIPKYKPDYVLVQYSPWLVTRALAKFAPSFFGRLPTPYFVVSNGVVSLHPPLFEEKVFELPFSKYQGTSGGLGVYFSLLFQVGVPLFLHDDYYESRAYLKDLQVRLWEGRSTFPDPGKSQEVIDYTYREIARLCREQGARMIIVKLGDGPVWREFEHLPDLEGVPVADALSAEVKLLPSKDLVVFEKAYEHWRGSPPIRVDNHPNPRAHRIIAEEILKAIKGDTLAERAAPNPYYLISDTAKVNRL